MANQITHQNTAFKVGDIVRVYHKILEGEKSRVQIFEGIVFSIKKGGDPTFGVRKIASGAIGVEKIFPLNAPVITKVEVKKPGNVKRAKLYYLRERVGKRALKVRSESLDQNNSTKKPS